MMRKAKKFILMCLMTVATVTVNAQTESQYDWTKLMNAIIQVESKGNPNARNPVGDCCGILQITPGLVKQCNAWFKAKKSNKRYTLADRYDVQKSKEMFVMYQHYYNPSNNVEKAIRIWNGGPGYSTAKTENYYRKVMKYYNGDK